jgi:hypothetical protein
MEQRERAISHLGEAHKNAEEERVITMRHEAERKDKFDKFQVEAKTRGK